MSRVEGTSAECRGELLRRAQRGVITENERLALTAHLSACEACRSCHEFMRDFEAVGGAAPGDSAVLARISERAMRTVSTPVVRRSRLRVYWLAAASIALLAGLAGATLLDRQRVPARPSPSSAAAQPAAARTATLQSLEPAAPSPLPIEAPSPTPMPDASSNRASPSSARTTGSTRNRPADTAASLFREANEARRAGDAALAVSLYRELQRRFPAAAETQISRISLGSVLLDTGAAAPALQQFESYLAAPSGALAAEAIYGRGRALKNLHRSTEEAATWQSLLTRFPRSPYASYAKRRLAELD